MEWDKNTKIIVAVVVVVILIAAGVGIALSMNNNNGGGEKKETTNITYDGNGGKYDGKDTYKSTSTTVESCKFTKEGYEFNYWLDENQKAYEPGSSITGTHTLKAQWLETGYYVKATIGKVVGSKSATLNGTEITLGISESVKITNKEVTLTIVSEKNWNEIGKGQFQNRAYYKETTINQSKECIVELMAYDGSTGKVLNSQITTDGKTITMKVTLETMTDFKIDFIPYTTTLLDADGGCLNNQFSKKPYWVYDTNDALSSDTFVKSGYKITGYTDLNGKTWKVGEKYTGEMTVLKAVWEKA